MNYSDIVDTALAYADRTDSTEVASRIDKFLRVVEARVNRVLQTRMQSKRAQIVTTEGQEFYGLPDDFAGLRDIEIVVDNNRQTLQFMAPEALSLHINSSGVTPAYTIIGNSIRVWPQGGNQVIEILYYQRIIPLSSTATENWLSKISPDAYIQGLLVEINTFVKDADAAALWDGRFRQTLADMELEDSWDRWSGPTMSVRLL